jgi:hypothetical protein
MTSAQTPRIFLLTLLKNILGLYLQGLQGPRKTLSKYTAQKHVQGLYLQGPRKTLNKYTAQKHGSLQALVCCSCKKGNTALDHIQGHIHARAHSLTHIQEQTQTLS